MFQVNGSNFLSKSLRNYIIARFIQKDFYMKNKDKVNRSNDKKQRNVCKRKKSKWADYFCRMFRDIYVNINDSELKS